MRNTIILEEFLDDEARLEIFLAAVSQIRGIGAEAMLLELSNVNSAPAAVPNLTEHGQLRAAWRDGYYECLKDIFRFRERYVDTEPAKTRQPDFAAGEALIRNNDITKEEYESIIAERESLSKF